MFIDPTYIEPILSVLLFDYLNRVLFYIFNYILSKFIPLETKLGFVNSNYIYIPELVQFYSLT